MYCTVYVLYFIMLKLVTFNRGGVKSATVDRFFYSIDKTIVAQPSAVHPLSQKHKPLSINE